MDYHVYVCTLSKKGLDKVGQYLRSSKHRVRIVQQGGVSTRAMLVCSAGHLLGWRNQTTCYHGKLGGSAPSEILGSVTHIQGDSDQYMVYITVKLKWPTSVAIVTRTLNEHKFSSKGVDKVGLQSKQSGQWGCVHKRYSPILW